MNCPVCGEYGHIVKAKITKANAEIYVCEECDSTWQDRLAAGSEKFHPLREVLESHGLPNDWKELSEIEDDWEKG